jgi:hypothetical protein
VTEIPRVLRPVVVHSCISIPGKPRTITIPSISGVSKVPVNLDISAMAQSAISSIAVVFGGLYVGREALLKLVEIGQGWFGVFPKGRRRGLASSACVHL